MRAVGLVALALVAPVGCDALVSLGPGASLVDASSDEASVPDVVSSPDANPAQDAAPESSSPADAGAPETGYACGLAPQGNVACDTCDTTSCCAVDLACAQNPRCAEAAAKLQNCIYDAVCVDQVDNDYADSGVLDLQSCTISSCIGPCFPGQICSQLATCCTKQIPSNLPSLSQACISSVNKLDEKGCQSFLDNVLLPQLPAGACGSTPVDAGGD